MIKLCISGHTGRVGKELTNALIESVHFELASGIANTSTSSDIEEAIVKSDAVIDFSRPENTMIIASICAVHKKPLLIGTTGFSAEQLKELQDLALKNTMFLSYNMSLSVNTVAQIAAQTAVKLGDDYDIEIIEYHHNKKIDAPSGTALMIANEIIKAKGQTSEVFTFDRFASTQARKKGSIGFSSVRAGSIIGEHKVIFANECEIIEVTSKIQNRNVFALGALKAMRWLVQQEPTKLYTSTDL